MSSRRLSGHRSRACSTPPSEWAQSCYKLFTSCSQVIAYAAVALSHAYSLALQRFCATPVPSVLSCRTPLTPVPHLISLPVSPCCVHCSRRFAAEPLARVVVDLVPATTSASEKKGTVVFEVRRNRSARELQSASQQQRIFWMLFSERAAAARRRSDMR